MEACAITAYQSSPTAISQLIVDEAPPFKCITPGLGLGLCWSHEGRHFKKMIPMIPDNTALLETFREQFRDYYQQLLDYKENPSDKGADVLSKRFDALFSHTTGHEKRDKQITLTRAKKDELLRLLKFPFIPNHNNPAESGTRVHARNRDIHWHTMSEVGTKTKDTLAALSETANKRAVNFYEYVLDRITRKYKMPSLAEVIKQHAVVMLR